MEKEIEIILTNLMAGQDKTAQAIMEMKDNSNKILAAVQEQSKRTAKNAETALSESSQEQRYNELIRLIRQQGDIMNELKKQADKQQESTTRFRTIRLFPMIDSAQHYKLLFTSVQIILAIVLSFILLSKVFNHYFVTA